MKLYSTNNRNLDVTFPEAVFNSMPQDKGLYMPQEVNLVPAEFIENIKNYTLPEIAYQVASTLLGDALPSADLKRIVEEAINFDAPAVRLDKTPMCWNYFMALLWLLKISAPVL